MIAEHSFLSLFGLSAKQILGDSGSSSASSSNSISSTNNSTNNNAAKAVSANNVLTQTVATNSNPVVKIIRPPRLAAYAAADFTKLSAEKRARVAVTNAFKESFFKMTRQYQVFGIVGYGGNGVVLSAKERLPEGSSLSVAIKIIYRRTLADSSDSEDIGGTTDERVPAEISALQCLNRSCKSSSVLKYLDHWKDAKHYYLVTQLFGSNWLKEFPDFKLPRLEFQSVSHSKVVRTHTLAVSLGACDLWAWSVAHRTHVQRTSNTTLLPLTPIKHIVRETAKALNAIHKSGFYHGDVKVENILVEYPQAPGSNKTINGSNCPNVMLSDYGHTRAAEKGIKRYGTQEISPPEFIEGSPFLGTVHLDGRRSDVFALGMVAFVLLSDGGDIPDACRSAERGSLDYQSLCANGNECFPFNDKEIENMPDNALDLLCRMCAMDPAKRPTLDQVLSHQWLQ
ncbi:MAP kinase-interacting serine/threonine-protein kinase 1 [Physocladia obscura]|uniref:MAP kinase-interacting serine/threonine-protein kinase 1 n=1 Tax=Physocladia obscura TaxID=109957 RepID=A0AAD5T3Q0_9FUNG|nr:MAP kinase-interacting serine/threonine-protein kinase 1 [Physocladia obscura]